MTADSARLRGKTGEVEAFGNVHFFDGKNTFDAKRLVFNVDTKLGILYNGKLFIKEDNYHIEGEKITRTAIDRYELEIGSFTSCDCEDDRAWHFRAKKLDLHVDEYLFAKHVLFYVKDIPVFYIPYFVIPVKRERQSGLLIPRIGYSSRYGLRYEQDFFWAIAKNQDATLTFAHRGDKGNGLGLEYRYIGSKETFGKLNTTYFRDRENAIDRWEVRYGHEQRFTKRVYGKLDIVYINENDNFQDLSDKTADRALQNIESNLFLTYKGNTSVAFLLARFTQDLTAPNNNDTPQRLPEIGYSLIEYHPENTPFYINLDTSAVNFWSEGGLNLQRVDLYQKVALPIRLGRMMTLTPWVGFRETWYSHGKAANPSVRREIVPSGITLAGHAVKRWAAATHIINPSIMYENIVVDGGEDVHQIDELDALHDRKNITLTLMQRLMAPDHSGVPTEKASLRFTETIHLDQIPTRTPKSNRYSDLRSELRLKPWPQVSIKFDSFYNIYDNQLTSLNSDLHLFLRPYVDLKIGQRKTLSGTLPKKGDLFNPYYLGDREAITPEIDFWSETLSITTPWGIRFVNKLFYDKSQKKVVEVDYIVEIQHQCWGIGLSYLDFHDRNEFSFVITLKGLGGFSPEQ